VNKHIPLFSPLTKKELHIIRETIENGFGDDFTKFNQYSFYKTQRDKVYMTTFSLEENRFKNINSIGIYFGTFHDSERFRLSIEASQYINPIKNYIVLKDHKALQSYLAAENIFEEDIKEKNITNTTPFIIVQYENENLGCVSKKEGYYLSYIPKSRKLDFNKVF
jgi:ribosome biogenesis protein Nip4